MTESIEKRCVECGTEIPTISDTPLCSKSCQEDYANRMIRSMSDDDAWCPTCGNSFHDVSSVCYHHNKKHSFELHRHKFCENCDERFIPKNHSNDNKYCSESCFGEDNRAELITLSCENCGDSFSVLPCLEDRIYCSNSCANSGEHNHAWIDGRSYGNNYCKNWRSQRKLAIERDFCKCRSCGMSRDEHRERFGRDISVHHKIPIATFDYIEKGNRLTNLITLCIDCHQRVEDRVIK